MVAGPPSFEARGGHSRGKDLPHQADLGAARPTAVIPGVRNSAEPEPGLGASSLAGIIADEASDEARARRRADRKAAFVRIGATMGDR